MASQIKGSPPRAGLLLPTLVATLVAPALQAQQPPQLDEPLDEQSAFEEARATTVVDAAELRRDMPANASRALATLPQMHLIYGSFAGGMPVLRGMLGSEVLLLLDGIRLNNAVTRLEPNQLLSGIDPFLLDGLTVVRGPGSVRYGSDAMGGVIALRRAVPAFDWHRSWDVESEAYARYHGASQGFVGGAAVSGHLRQFGLRLGGSFRRFDDLLGGRDVGRQRFTSYWGGTFDLGASWSLGSAGMLRLSYTTLRDSDAPRPLLYGTASAVERATAPATPRDFSVVAAQWRDIVALSYRVAPTNRWIQALEASLSFQLHQQERQRLRLERNRIQREEDDVGTLALDLALSSALPHNRLTYGVTLQHDRVDSTAEQEGITTRTVTQFDRGRYLSDSAYTRFGLFVIDRLTLGRLSLDLGGRLAGWDTQIPADQINRLEAIDTTRLALLGSLHARYLIGDGLNLVAGLSQGYRAPNVDDLTARGCGDGSYEVPNADLDPERSVSAEGGVKLDLFGVLSGSLFYFYSLIDDAIIEAPGSGPVEDACGVVLPVVQRINARQVQIHGIESEVRLALGRFTLFGWLAWTRGQLTLDLPGSFSEPADRIPPLNGRGGVRYHSADERWQAQLAIRWATRQHRLSSADRGDRAICFTGPDGCRGTPGYAVVEVNGAARLHEMLRLTVAIRNLTNESYRTHGSALDGPGLSAVVGMELAVR